MKFGPVSPDEALGGICVHAVRHGDVALKKGVKVGPEDVAALKRAGVEKLVVAQLEAGDLAEDDAATLLAQALRGPGVRVDEASTGRANLFATETGLLIIDRDAVNRVNRVDPALTLATLAAFKPVVAGEMIGTVKIIPFGAPRNICETAAQIARSARVVAVQPYRIKKVAVISTLLPGLAEKVIDKTLKVTAGRLALAGASIVADRRVAHDEAALQAALSQALQDGAELVLIFGASAIADRRDVIPAAIESAGGHIRHFGMPVDPGNLMLIGDVKGVPVLGAPGCARSPKENGFDWILSRILAGVEVSSDDITGMGVGGLLMEIVSRPQLRVAQTEQPSKVAAIILAAGLSRRMGAANKMLARIGGKPLVRIVVEQALASNADPVIVVTGHEGEQVRAALDGLAVTFIANADFIEGLASSVRAGIAAVPDAAEGALILLGDMPRVDSAMIDTLIAALAPDRGGLIAVPVQDGRRGNPVVWARRFFPELLTLEGDSGARALIQRHAEAVIEVPVSGDGAFFDVDTRQALDEAGGAAPDA